MPRTDENGRQLKTLLDYLLDGDVDARAIYDALGTSSSTYYRRIKEADYPNAEEMRLVADRFNLSYPDLQVRFGLMTREEVWNYVESAPSRWPRSPNPGPNGERSVDPSFATSHREPTLPRYKTYHLPPATSV